MMKSKRISFIAAVLTAILLASAAMPVPGVRAEDSGGNEAFEYEVNDDGKSIKITSYRGLGSSVKIPSAIDGREVIGIGKSAFASCSQIEVLSIPVSVAEIDELAFSGCSQIKEISIPDEVTEIGRMAFANCTSLKIVNFGEKLKKVDDYAFMGCTSLSELLLPASTEEIGRYAFFNCHSLANPGALSKVRSVGEYAFENTGWVNNYNGDYLTVGDGLLVKYKGNGKKLSLDKKIKTVGSSAFLDNKTITGIKVSANTEKILDGAFEGASALESVDLSASKANISNRAFEKCTKLKEIKLSNAMTSIGKEAFIGCKSLTKISIPDSVEQIGDSAFSGCSALSDVTIGSGVKKLGEKVFASCNALGKIEIPGSVAQVADDCFSGCVSLTRAVIEGDARIGYAFSGCLHLEEAAFLSNSPFIDDHAFVDCPDVVIYAANGSSAEKFAEEKHIACEPLSKFAFDGYIYKGVFSADESTNDGFSVGYTTVVIFLIIGNILIAFLISAYVLIKGPEKRSMRHAKTPSHIRK